MLTGINGTTVASDAIGNMLSDGTWTYTWEHGRELASMSSGGTTWSFTYDANGMRTQRTDGTTTYSSGVLPYSIGMYCNAMANDTNGFASFAQATAVYGYYAKQYFG